LLRIWVITLEPKFSHPVFGRLKYAFTPIALIDLFAILPFFLPLLNIDLRVLRIFRVFRLFRMLKIARYFKALNLMYNVFRNKKEELVMILSFILFMLVLSATLMYYIENAVQPDAFASIPAAMWWGIATLTTVGYGDVYPVTPLGQVLGAFIALLGIGFFALPTGILASGFSEEIRKRKNETTSCPHCGKELPE
jgi:voltage-gated potassium channel